MHHLSDRLLHHIGPFFFVLVLALPFPLVFFALLIYLLLNFEEVKRHARWVFMFHQLMLSMLLEFKVEKWGVVAVTKAVVGLQVPFG